MTAETKAPAKSGRTRTTASGRGSKGGRGSRSGRAKKEPLSNTREDLEAHVAAFLEAGGKVQYIESGVSGQTSTKGPRQIVLSHKNSS